MSIEAAIIALSAVVVLLSLPALARAYRIIRFHHQLGPAAGPFIIAADAAGKHGDA